jgi:diguanylate cyclase (GGDEF)-like protein
MDKRKLLRNDKQISNLALLIVVILAIGFTSTTGLSYYLTREFVLNKALTETLPLVSENIYTEIMEDLIDPITTSSLMANDSFLISWVKSGEEDLEAIQEYLGLIKAEYGFSSSFLVSDLSHNYYTDQGVLKQISAQDPHDVWYYAFRDLNKDTDLDVDTDESDQGELTVFINHRLDTPEDGFLGVTGVGLKIIDISKKLMEYEERYQHQVYFVDSVGLIQIHPDTDLVEKQNITEIAEIKQSYERLFSMSGEINSIEIKNLLGGRAFSVRYFPEFDWYLVVEKEHGANIQLAKDVFWQTIAISIGVSLLIGLLIIQLIKVFHSRLAYQASVDSLTGVLNRRAILEAGEREIKIARRYQSARSILMIDIEDFKSVNNQFGHLTGDDFIRNIARILQGSLRESDLIGRWGGDEFVIVLLDTDEESAHEVAERLKQVVATYHFDTGQGMISRNIYVGICEVADGNEDFSEMIRAADEALIRSKNDQIDSGEKRS